MATALRIFLDANILFSAAKSSGAVRQLLHDLHAEGHVLAADAYVAAEAQRNIATKSTDEAMHYLQALLSRIDVSAVKCESDTRSAADWLPEKDRPVLLAAIASHCDVLVTGDRTHFGLGYGRTFEGVKVVSPAQLALALWGERQSTP